MVLIWIGDVDTITQLLKTVTARRLSHLSQRYAEQPNWLKQNHPRRGTTWNRSEIFKTTSQSWCLHHSIPIRCWYFMLLFLVELIQ